MWRKLITVSFLFSSVYASALMMTFDGIEQASPDAATRYTEDGITATAVGFGELGYFSTPGVVHLDDSGTPIAGSIGFTTGNVFDAVSVDILALGESEVFAGLINLSDFDEEISLRNVPYDNVRVQGFRSGAVVAEDQFYMGDVSEYFFGADFTNLDALIFTALQPDFSVLEASLLADFPGFAVFDLFCFDAPCAHFELDNLVLSAVTPVPVPAALPLFLGALAAFGFIRRRKSRQ